MTALPQAACTRGEGSEPNTVSEASAVAGDGCLRLTLDPVNGAQEYDLYWASEPLVAPGEPSTGQASGSMPVIPTDSSIVRIVDGSTYYFVLAPRRDSTSPRHTPRPLDISEPALRSCVALGPRLREPAPPPLALGVANQPPVTDRAWITHAVDLGHRLRRGMQRAHESLQDELDRSLAMRSLVASSGTTPPGELEPSGEDVETNTDRLGEDP